MNKICKEYISEIKALFPIKRKPEKDYIKKIAADVADYCEEANVTSKQELYDNYGRPNDVVNNYFATVDTEYIVKQISTKRLLKTFLVIMLLLATIVTAAIGSCAYISYYLAERNAVVIREDSIVEFN